MQASESEQECVHVLDVWQTAVVTPSGHPLPHGIFTCSYRGHLAAVSEEQL